MLGEGQEGAVLGEGQKGGSAGSRLPFRTAGGGKREEDGPPAHHPELEMSWASPLEEGSQRKCPERKWTLLTHGPGLATSPSQKPCWD